MIQPIAKRPPAALLLFAGCAPVREARQYREVLAAKSLAKAESFLREHPRGRYRQRLVEELRRWAEPDTDPQLVERVEQILSEGGNR